MATVVNRKQKRFSKKEILYPLKRIFREGDIFEINTIWGSITYAKVTDEWQQLFYDLEECDSAGKPIPNPLVCGMVLNSIIVAKLEERSWRLFFNLIQCPRMDTRPIQREKTR